MIYPPRMASPNFARSTACVRWGGGVPISSRDFFTLNLNKALAQALAARPGAAPY